MNVLRYLPLLAIFIILPLTTVARADGLTHIEPLIVPGPIESALPPVDNIVLPPEAEPVVVTPTIAAPIEPASTTPTAENENEDND